MAVVGSKIKLEKKLNEGAYGSIYSCTDEHGNLLAAKCIRSGKFGISEILEANIMATMKHPNINSAISIQAKSAGLYIVQDLALSDLAKFTRKTHANTRICGEDLKRMIFNVIRGLAFFHENNMIHGDMKASNLLYYSNGEVKITDFSFSAKVWDQSTKFNHPVGTSTHRAPENLQKREWSYPLDIWALGCTIFELVYGMSLFPYQGEIQTDEKMLLCLYDWFEAVNQWRLDGDYVNVYHTNVVTSRNDCNNNVNNTACNKEAQSSQMNQTVTGKSKGGMEGGIGQTPPGSPITSHSIKFEKFRLPEEWGSTDNIEINRLIVSMLRYKAEDRPKIQEIIDNSWFNSCRDSCQCQVVRPKYNGTEMNSRLRDQFTMFVREACISGILEELTMILFIGCTAIKNLTLRIRFFGCLWIAYKLMGVDPKSEKMGNISDYVIFDAERIICNTLKFRLC